MERDPTTQVDRITPPSGRRPSRTQSISSDKASINGCGVLISPPLTVTPEPAYIAASAASQIVTNDHDSHAETWLENHGIEPSGETALVAPAALKLVNHFLDQLLFNFLSISRSTSLAALRPAVAEVLKTRLAQDAIGGADQELHEYLGGGDDGELLDANNGEAATWDLELIWKRTRLRCMVYSSLGDMEEEDEDYYMEHENLNEAEGSLTVSPAVAIFLTSILEFMGEQALVIAGQAAYHRLRLKHEKDLKEGTNMPVSEIAERVVVDETDMERVALDRTVGRLWRGWKKRVRSQNSSVSMNRSYSTVGSRSTSASHSLEEDDKPTSIAEVVRDDERAAAIPLPMRDDDVREIEVPGLAPRYDDEEEDVAEESDIVPRPKSMMAFPTTQPLPTPDTSEPHTPTIGKTRQRSFSVPSPVQSNYKSPTPALTEDGVNESIEIEEPKDVTDAEQPKTESHKGLVAGIVAGAAAVSGVAAAGLKIITSGEESRPRTADQDDFDDEDIAEEEPQIMTSSRVSIGPSSPNIGQAHSPIPGGRSPSVNSVHSLRLIDVQSPRSPGPTRQSSVDDYHLSRTASGHSIHVSSELQPNNSPAVRGRQSPLMRNGSGLSVSAASIAEEREEHDGAASDHTDKAGSTQGVRKPATADSDKPFVLAAPPAARNNRDASISQMKTAQYGAPVAAPLAPLHEIKEGAPDIPEEDKHESRPKLQSRSKSERNEGSPAPSKARSVHKSSSSTSSHKLRAVRTSEDSMPGQNDKGQSFEQLIRSDQTIQYTLTPQNMRGIDGPDAENSSPKTTRSTRSRSASRSDSRGNINKQTGLYSNPPTPRPATQGGRSRNNGPQARDARVDRDSIGDFAEFIRSTGPPGATMESVVPRSAPSTAHSHRGANGSSRNASTSLAKPGAQPVLPKRSMSSATRARLQAREAVVPFGDNSSDLIDFIRQGPSGDTPRIPRTVAPFRTTMDSDQMVGAVPPAHLEPSADLRDSLASTTVSQNTINSNTALLNKKPAQPPKMDFDEEDMIPKRKTRRVKDPYAIDFSDEDDDFGEEPAAAPPKRPQPEEDMMPKRKTRRVKDPYAIDFSDEEDDDFGVEPALKPKKPQRQEESLMDFLNNVPPPPPEPVRKTSVFDEPPARTKLLRSKSSAPSLISRFRTTTNAQEPVPKIPTTFSNGTKATPNRKGSVSNDPQSVPRSTPQVPPPNNTRNMNTHAERMPSGKKTATSDLADFFRDSEPPPMPPTRRFAEEEKPQSGFARFFRKKAAA